MNEAMVMVMEENKEEKTLYVMVHKATGATITCTENFKGIWMAKGFSVQGIKKGNLDVALSDSEYNRLKEEHKGDLED